MHYLLMRKQVRKNFQKNVSALLGADTKTEHKEINLSVTDTKKEAQKVFHF